MESNFTKRFHVVHSCQNVCSFFLILLKSLAAAVQNTSEKSWATDVAQASCGGPSLLTPSWGSPGVVVMPPPCPGPSEF